jgi:hypothetical protein
MDPFTLTHVSHGTLLFIFLVLIWWRLLQRLPSSHHQIPNSIFLVVGFALAIAEATWEFSENSPLVINAFRSGGLSRDYYGDSWINMFGDWSAAMIGYILCVWFCFRGYQPVHVVKGAAFFFLFTEVCLIVYQHDCMVFIWIQLLSNPDWLVQFQLRETWADLVITK